MRLIVPLVGLVGALAGCGDLTVAAVGAGTTVSASDPAGGSGFTPTRPVVPASVDIDPDLRRGLGPDGMKIDCGKAKCVALTFDDGPLEDTERLLGMLAEHHAKATFFVVGSMVQEDPSALKKTVEAGHEIANHSWSHANLAGLSAAGVHSQLQKTQDIVKETAGVTPVLLRPPYGATNARVAGVAKELGMPQILWTVDPMDWRDRSATTVSSRVIAGARRGGVVLMHDIHPTTVDAVPRILDRLADRGYKFVTVSELFHGTKFRPGRIYTERTGSAAR